MEIQQPMADFLKNCDVVDWQCDAIRAQASALAKNQDDDEAIARACFMFVRDDIRHSWDYQQNPVTCKASEVLRWRTGYCYAKSHLLAALLRANGIPAGLCYQRLTLTDQPPFCLHGLNAVYLQRYGWYRIDARGNKATVNADFTPPREQLAFALVAAGEKDYPEIWADPHPAVIDCLQRYHSVQEVFDHLPDLG